MPGVEPGSGMKPIKTSTYIVYFKNFTVAIKQTKFTPVSL